MRVLVCGGREYDDYPKLKAKLDALHAFKPITLIIEGGARGADELAGRWARENSIKYLIFPADWEQHGRAAGPLRNQQMLDEGKPDVVMSFPGGSGTADMVKRALRRTTEVPNLVFMKVS